MKKKILKIGLPKGSLQESTFRMLRKAGFNPSLPSERSYFPSLDDPEIEAVLLRAQEMSRYVADGALDCGITGNDWILENNSDVVRITDLMYAKQSLNKVRWVLAVPEASGIKSVKDLKGRRIATELVNATREFFRRNKVNVEVEFSWGATEVKVSSGLVDAIVELTETGRSLKANKLIEIATICESTTQFISSRASYKDSWKKAKMEEIAVLLKGAIAAEEKVGLKMNVKKANLSKVSALLPALKRPTISMLSEEGWVAVETIIDEKVVRALIPRLKKCGAEGIIEYPLNKVIY
ncbi:MAG: ATP phosphoribosyltransferase [Candidatus Omnitrophota bacterium]